MDQKHVLINGDVLLYEEKAPSPLTHFAERHFWLMTNPQLDCLLLVAQFWRRAIQDGHPQQEIIAGVLAKILDAHIALTAARNFRQN